MKTILLTLTIILSCQFSPSLDTVDLDDIEFFVTNDDSKFSLSYTDTSEEAIAILSEIELLINQRGYGSILSDSSHQKIIDKNSKKINRLLTYRGSIDKLLEPSNQSKKAVINNAFSTWYLNQEKTKESLFVYHTFYYDNNSVSKGLMSSDNESPFTNFLGDDHFNEILKNNGITEIADFYRLSLNGLGINLKVFKVDGEYLCIPYVSFEQQYKLKNNNVYQLTEVINRINSYLDRRALIRTLVKVFPYLIGLILGITSMLVLIVVRKKKRLMIIKKIK